MGLPAGALLTTRTASPEPGVATMQKNGHCPSTSDRTSIACTLLSGPPCSSSIRASSGWMVGSAVFRTICTLSTVGSKWYRRLAPPSRLSIAEMHSAAGDSTVAALPSSLADRGNSTIPLLRMAIVFVGPGGIMTTALKGHSLPLSVWSCSLQGVLSGPHQSSTFASYALPSVSTLSCTFSTEGEVYDHVRREPPGTTMLWSAAGAALVGRVGATLPFGGFREGRRDPPKNGAFIERICSHLCRRCGSERVSKAATSRRTPLQTLGRPGWSRMQPPRLLFERALDFCWLRVGRDANYGKKIILYVQLLLLCQPTPTAP